MTKELKEKNEFLQGKNACLEISIDAIMSHFEKTRNINIAFLTYTLPDRIDKIIEGMKQREEKAPSKSFQDGFQEGKEVILAFLPSRD